VTPGASRGSAVLRVTRFRPREPWADIGRALRTRGIPAFLAQPGLVDAWFGRRGPEFEDEHVIAAVWGSAAAERAAVRLRDVLAGPDVAVDDGGSIALPVVLDLRFPRPGPVAILRLYDGRTHPGQLDAYVREAAQGAQQDGQSPAGPAAVCMSVDPPDHFVTVSLWTGWSSIEACTGGDVRRPLATRNRDRLAAGGPTHYEVIQPL
jgi:hypothetical protein